MAARPASRSTTRHSQPARHLLLVLALLLVPRVARADVISTWMHVTDFALGKAGLWNQSARTPATSRVYPQVALAMFEAANAIQPRYTSWIGGITASAGISQQAAASYAAYHVLSTLVPSQQAIYDDALTLALAEIPEGSQRTQAQELGKRAATAVMAKAALSSGRVAPAYRPLTAPGVYIAPGLPAIQPYELLLPPFMLDSAAALAPPSPPDLTSAAYARDLDEVRRLGGKEASERPAAKALLAPALLYVDLGALYRQVSDRPGRTLIQNARLYALGAMAEEDTWLAIMEAKMRYARWRPITAIRNADQDGNDATARVEDWRPFLATPAHADYPCGHCGMASVTAAILESETGPAPAGGITIRSSEENPALAITVPTWKAFVDEMSMSRIYAGAHTRTANDVAEAMGRAVARLALTKFLRPTSSTASGGAH